MVRPSIARRAMAIVVSAIVVIAAGGSVSAQQQAGQGVIVHLDSLHSSIIGRVADSTGAPIGGARVSLMPGDSLRAVTSDSGMFRFDSLPAGAHVFSIRRFGYEPMTFTAVLKGAKTNRVHVTLDPATQGLPAVSVTDTASGRWLASFNARRANHPGSFITRAEFESSNPKSSSDILRRIPGVSVSMNNNGTNRVVFTRNGVRGCRPTMYIHGSPFGGQIDDLPVEDIEAVEVYVGVSEIPAEFDRVGRNVCAVINVWTRDPRKPPQA